jgi:hypothetical protein
MLARRTGLLGAFFAALLAAAPNAGAETWRNYTSAADGFAVEVSGDVKGRRRPSMPRPRPVSSAPRNTYRTAAATPIW